jgi:thiamine pyrophosphate-dependent acetolactate synthase large subunit-like protein
MTLMALGAMPMDHPLSIGMLGMHGARYTNYVLEEADLLICVGARFDDRAIGKTAEFCPNAKIIHIDIDRSELHKVKNAHVAIAGDVGRCSPSCCRASSRSCASAGCPTWRASRAASRWPCRASTTRARPTA